MMAFHCDLSSKQSSKPSVPPVFGLLSCEMSAQVSQELNVYESAYFRVSKPVFALLTVNCIDFCLFVA